MQKVWIQGNIIDLTYNEFEILKYLYSQSGKVCSTQSIIQNAFNEEYSNEFGDNRRLQTAISRLREKLRNFDDIIRIRTQRSVGYWLDIR